MALLDHVGVRVTNLDRAVTFYSEMFGFKMEDRRMLGGGDSVEAAMMRVGELSVLFLLYNPEFEAQPPHVKGRPDHFCLTFESHEFDGVMQRLEAAGVFERLDCKLSPRTGVTGRSDSKYILDPDNNQVEVKVRVGVEAGTNGSAGTLAGAH